MAAKKKRPKVRFKAPAKKRVKAGGNKASATARHVAFVNAYLSNGGNASKAAISAGYSPHSANVTGSRMLRYADVKERLEAARAAAALASGLSVERTFQRAAQLAYFDIRSLFTENGNLRNVVDLDPQAAAAVASLELEEIYEGKGGSRTLAGHLRKVKVVEPVGALRLAAQLQGLLNPEGPAIISGSAVIVVQAGRYDEQI